MGIARKLMSQMFGGLSGPATVQKKLASSGSLEALKKLVAEFYYTTPERISFIPEDEHWRVQSGEKQVSPIVVRQGKRFVFGTAGDPKALSGLSGAPFMSKGYSQYGASMGRHSDSTITGKLHLQRVPIDQGGYDPGGAYWGTGQALWAAWDEDGSALYLRASDREAAKKEIVASGRARGVDRSFLR